MRREQVDCIVCNGTKGEGHPVFYRCAACNGEGFQFKVICEGSFKPDIEDSNRFICDECGAMGPYGSENLNGMSHRDYCNSWNWDDFEKRHWGYYIWYENPDSQSVRYFGKDNSKYVG